MSDNSESSDVDVGEEPHDKVRHEDILLSAIENLYISDTYSDVILIVHGHKFPAHKVILAAQSQYFQALLYGKLKESSQAEIELKDVAVGPFTELLHYVYSGRLSLANLNEQIVLELLKLSQQYCFVDLVKSICSYLDGSLSNDNVFNILKTAQLCQLEDLIQTCYQFIDQNAKDLVQNKGFMQLPCDTLCSLLSRDSFNCPESDIFVAVQSWIEHNLSDDNEKKTVLGNVRFDLICPEVLLTDIRSSGLVSSEVLLDAFTRKFVSDQEKLKYRGAMVYDKNVAEFGMGARVLEGTSPEFLLNGETTNYEKQYTWHNLDDPGIIIKLDSRYIINHIKLLLWDLDDRSYSYYIEVSANPTNKSDWEKVIDNRNYYCQSWQWLFFEPRVVQYIRIVGTQNTSPDDHCFHAVHFDAGYVDHNEKICDGFIVPKSNIALANKATVASMYCLNPMALFDGDTENYDEDDGYTSPKSDYLSIIIQFGQPYIIDSMRFLLWDLDDRYYSYYIEVSGDRNDWELIVDKRIEICRSWQTVDFKASKPFVFIRITATQDSANKGFRCVHFECPAAVENNVAE